jgi:hypothetical protein
MELTLSEVCWIEFCTALINATISFITLITTKYIIYRYHSCQDLISMW